MNSINQTIDNFLLERKQNSSFRSLTNYKNQIDFASNDYLGLSKSAFIHQQIQQYFYENKNINLGATGSRLISGNSEIIENLEKKLAQFHDAESALIFNSGYDANVGLIATVCRKNDIIYYDKYCHSSILQAIKLSGSKAIVFEHNNTTDLQKKLLPKTQNCNQFLITESLFSMDGDFAPLENIANICTKNNIALIVDEAHSNGIFGNNGNGFCYAKTIQHQCFARVYTFGKAIGSHGAVIVGNQNLKNYLINFSKPFIYSTALDLATIVHIQFAYQFLENNTSQRQKLIDNIHYFKNKIIELNLKINVESQIISIPILGNENCIQASKKLLENNIYAKAILFPTVPKNQERIRICLHSFNTQNEINLLIKLLSNFIKK